MDLFARAVGLSASDLYELSILRGCCELSTGRDSTIIVKVRLQTQSATSNSVCPTSSAGRSSTNLPIQVKRYSNAFHAFGSIIKEEKVRFHTFISIPRLFVLGSRLVVSLILIPLHHLFSLPAMIIDDDR